ncbi:hypothetical protein AcV5_004102 [Taiwanofungus camphoratus]|nr:hypothetical protein AcV5_004102 [Antrodia cinnamomea]
MAMTPIWEASPPPPEDWGDDANAEWPVLGIVSEEINAVGNKLYEVKWGQWHRPDGTNTTWETEESMDDMAALRRAWDERQARKRVEAAARSSSMDIRVDPELLWHQDATVEVAQAYEEKKARWMARSLAKYQGWDDIEQMSDGSSRDDKSDDAQGSGGDEHSRSQGSRFDEDSDQEGQEDESDDDDGDGDPRPRSTSAATHLRPLSARSLLSKSTKATPRVATPLHTHNQSEPSIPKWPRPFSASRPPPQRLTSTFPVSPSVPSAFAPILSAPRTARPIKPLPQRKRQIIRSASPEFTDETVDRRAELQRSWTSAAKRSGAAFVTFVNEVNQEEVPPNLDGFQYCENYYVRVPGVPYSDETINCLVSCECTALCEDAGTCGCQGPSELVNDDGEKEFAYTDKGLFRFNLPPGVEVIECNKTGLPQSRRAAAAECPHRSLPYSRLWMGCSCDHRSRQGKSSWYLYRVYLHRSNPR